MNMRSIEQCIADRDNYANFLFLSSLSCILFLVILLSSAVHVFCLFQMQWVMVTTYLTHGDDIGGWDVRHRGWKGSVEQNAYEWGGSEGCFVLTSWLVGAFDVKNPVTPKSAKIKIYYSRKIPNFIL